MTYRTQASIALPAGRKCLWQQASSSALSCGTCWSPQVPDGEARRIDECATRHSVGIRTRGHTARTGGARTVVSGPFGRNPRRRNETTGPQVGGDTTPVNVARDRSSREERSACGLEAGACEPNPSVGRNYQWSISGDTGWLDCLTRCRSRLHFLRQLAPPAPSGEESRNGVGP